MKDPYENVACSGMDVHYKFSKVTLRDYKGRIIARERLDHRDREKLKQRFWQWPGGSEIVMEASF